MKFSFSKHFHSVTERNSLQQHRVRWTLDVNFSVACFGMKAFCVESVLCSRLFKALKFTYVNVLEDASRFSHQWTSKGCESIKPWAVDVDVEPSWSVDGLTWETLKLHLTFKVFKPHLEAEIMRKLFSNSNSQSFMCINLDSTAEKSKTSSYEVHRNIFHSWLCFNFAISLDDVVKCEPPR